MPTIANVRELTRVIADELKTFDSEEPKFRQYRKGIGPYGEPTLVKEIANRLSSNGYQSQTKKSPDMVIGDQWGIEFKIVRPFGDNGDPAEHWSQNLLHPYRGNVSLIGDALKLREESRFPDRCIVAICFEHEIPKIQLEPLLASFELIAREVLEIQLGKRVEEERRGLVHKHHQVLRCIGWRVIG